MPLPYACPCMPCLVCLCPVPCVRVCPMPVPCACPALWACPYEALSCACLAASTISAPYVLSLRKARSASLTHACSSGLRPTAVIRLLPALRLDAHIRRCPATHNCAREHARSLESHARACPRLERHPRASPTLVESAVTCARAGPPGASWTGYRIPGRPNDQTPVFAALCWAGARPAPAPGRRSGRRQCGQPFGWVGRRPDGSGLRQHGRLVGRDAAARRADGRAVRASGAARQGWVLKAQGVSPARPGDTP
jgi:hypothetical protein